ncbi:SGNH/GDSL hydrolase family protein [Mobilibacterium timonense]|uniref:SGNH/GDSL hydrolase family protein n=1 Tax=Mobilibacterium timonense TaxID=1871012 RepID=UPI000984CCF1|nr:SGNH/GDSL hydrolase family protein [Mobilibacterium timonense]
MKGICVFGDSVARGVVFDEARQRYTNLKENFISLTEERIHIPFKNFSVFGATISKGEQMMARRSDSLGSYEYSILEFGGNDCDLNWKEISESPSSDHPAKTPLDKYESTYREMIQSSLSRGLKPILLTLPPLDPERFFQWVSRGLDRDKIYSYIGGDVNNIYRWHKEYNDIVLSLGREYGLPVIDIRSALESQGDYSRFLCADGMHPNAEGHRLIADCLASSLGSLQIA